MMLHTLERKIGTGCGFGAASIAALLALTPTGSAQATVIQGASEGYGIQAELDIAGLIGIDVLDGTPGQRSSGAAPNPYDLSANLVNVQADAGTGIGPIAGTEVTLELASVDGVVSSEAQSDVDGTAGNRMARGFGLVNGLAANTADATVSLLSVVTAESNLLQITADTISAEAVVTGDHGALVASGNSVIQNLTLNVDGTALDIASLLGAQGYVDGDGYVIADPNTTILNIGGIANLNLILNEQIVGGDGVGDRTLEVNAIHLEFDGVDLGLDLVSELLEGDIIIGPADASLAAVPEPGALTLLGAGGALMARRPRREA